METTINAGSRNVPNSHVPGSIPSLNLSDGISTAWGIPACTEAYNTQPAIIRSGKRLAS
jgi:hypothetical protein